MEGPGHDAATPAEATGDDSDRLDVEFSRLPCDDGDSASCRDGTGKTQESRGGLTGGQRPDCMLYRVCGKKVSESVRLQCR